MTQAKLKPSFEKEYTVEEFEQLPEFGERYDLIDGKLVKRPMPGHEHPFIIDIIRDAIKAFDPHKELGYSLQEASVNLGERTAPTPDISYWKAERKVKRTKKAAPLPDLAVEVLSPSDVASPAALRSAMVKVTRLINANVPLVWVVNPKLKTVEVYHAGQRQPVQILHQGEELDGENVIPGFHLAVSDLFEEMEEE
jgi:Uma2 family endonuclease